MSDKNTELEARAVALVKQYGFILPRPVKDFLRELSAYLNWKTLEKNL